MVSIHVAILRWKSSSAPFFKNDIRSLMGLASVVVFLCPGKVRVLCAYGHDHTQACDKKDPATGLCIDILTGADSAWSSDEFTPPLNIGNPKRKLIFQSIHF